MIGCHIEPRETDSEARERIGITNHSLLGKDPFVPYIDRVSLCGLVWEKAGFRAGSYSSMGTERKRHTGFFYGGISCLNAEIIGKRKLASTVLSMRCSALRYRGGHSSMFQRCHGRKRGGITAPAIILQTHSNTCGGG